MKKFKFSFMAIMFILMTFLAACGGESASTGGSSDSDTINIGVVLATSGALAQTGTWVLEGHEAAAKKINDAGGVKIGDKSYKINLIHYDSEGRAESATAATERLINQDKVTAILGSSISSETAAMIPIAERSKTSLVTVAAASNILTEQGAKFFSQAAPANKNYVHAGAKTMKEMGMQKVAMLYVDDAWGQSYAELYPSVLGEYGLEFVITEKFSPEQTDFMTMLNKVKAQNPDGILLAAETELAVPLIKQLEEVMPDIKLMENAGSIPEELIKLAPTAAEGMVILSRAGAETPLISDFKEYHSTLHDYEANSFNFSGADGVNLIVDAMQRAGTVTDKEKINEAIRSAEFEGLIGTYTFNEKGENSLVGNRAIIKDGKPIYQSVDDPLPQ